MGPDERGAYLLAEARRADRERYLCALLAPAERRQDLLALVLLDAELARVPASVTQPMAGLIRYQWWREAIEGAAAGGPREHPVVEALAAGLARGAYGAPGLEALVDAREPELEGGVPSGLPAAEAHQDATAGALQELAAACLGARDEPGPRRAARLVGTAHGLARLARTLDGRERAPLLARSAALLAEARALVRRPPRPLMAAFLPARFAGATERTRPLAVLDLLASTLARRY